MSADYVQHSVCPQTSEQLHGITESQSRPGGEAPRSGKSPLYFMQLTDDARTEINNKLCLHMPAAGLIDHMFNRLVLSAG